MEKIAVIRIAGQIRIRKDMLHTLQVLGLSRKNACVILQRDISVMGMIQKVKDMVTWGPLDGETEKLLIEKRQKKGLDRQGKEIIKKGYNLHPPRKGYGRKGTKRAFVEGGALGDRGEAVNDLIRRML
ncbi:TPA: 50S ribosomal protein L30 [Candidatus Woesearchaeota archaeon]|nr:50S ribosomal protein L30 [Candidatus Woesearchaeota archaeon]HII68295.1 50S ribosomal protein L30 [Candidatus Woesearchaeota archaeon]